MSRNVNVTDGVFSSPSGEIFMCQITLKCLTSQGTACCRISNRSYRSLYWKYQSWMQWRGRVCCRSLYKALWNYKAREVLASHCDFLIGCYHHSCCINACLAEQNHGYSDVQINNKWYAPLCLMRNSSRWTQSGKETKIAWYFKATLHHRGKCMKICWEKAGCYSPHYQCSRCRGSSCITG